MEPQLQVENTALKTLIASYKQHIRITHFEGETYKWEFTKKYNQRPDINVLDFAKEFLALDFSIMMYQMAASVAKHIAKERPEKFRQAFKNLFDE